MKPFRSTAYSVTLVFDAADLHAVDEAVAEHQIRWSGAFGCFVAGQPPCMIVEFPRASIPGLLCHLPEPVAAKVAAQLDDAGRA